jgi:hypothetical protein
MFFDYASLRQRNKKEPNGKFCKRHVFGRSNHVKIRLSTVKVIVHVIEFG